MGTLTRATAVGLAVLVPLVSTGLVAIAPAGAASATVTAVRVSTAPSAVTDSSGQRWEASRGWTGGRLGVSRTIAVRGTQDDRLYRTERRGMSQFTAPVRNGTYDVTLRMTERSVRAPGRRVFDVTAEGRSALTGIDIYRAVGRNASYDRTVRVTVRDGRLDLGFVRRRGTPTVSAVRVQLVPPGTTITAGPASGSTTTATSASFSFTSDQPAGFQCRLDAAAWTACTSPRTVSVPVGVHTFSVRAVSREGVVDASPAARRWSVAAPAGAAPAGRPGASNTGVPRGTVLTPHYGDLTITTPGATYDALDVHGFVTVKAPNVRIRRSLVRGGVATRNRSLVSVSTTAAAGFVLEDSELAPAHPSAWIDGVSGGGFTLRRVNGHGTVDIVKVLGNDVTVESSWLHDARYFASDPNQGGGPTHNDGVQVLSGRNIRIHGNTISGASNAALQVTQDFGVTADLHFTGNWADGGGCTVNLAHKPLTSMSGITVRNNRFGRNSLFSGCAIWATRATALAADANVWDDTGAPVAVRDAG